jgi:CRISPR-associated endonuclease Cas3-HD
VRGEPISWCGEPLRVHLAATAAVAWSLYSRGWRVVAGRAARVLGAEPPGWALLLAGAIHDAGKAASCYQGRAAEACGRGEAPSFALHEYLSAYAGLLLARAAPLRGHAGLALYAAAEAALLHHHGMSQRGPRLLPPREALQELRRRGCGHPGRGDVEAMIGSALEACRLLEAEAGRLHVPGELVGGCLGTLAEASKEAIEGSSGGGAPTLLEALRLLAGEEVAGPPARPAFRAMSSLLAGAVSLADTVAASLCRSGRLGGYPLRVLGENPRLLGLLQRLEGVIRGFCGGVGGGGSHA